MLTFPIFSFRDNFNLKMSEIKSVIPQRKNFGKYSLGNSSRFGYMEPKDPYLPPKLVKTKKKIPQIMKAKIQNTDQSLKEKEILPFLSPSLGTSKRFRYDEKKSNPGPCEYEMKGQFGTERNK